MELYYFIESRPIIFTLILAALQWLVLEYICKKYPEGDKVEFKIKWGIMSLLLISLTTTLLYHKSQEFQIAKSREVEHLHLELVKLQDKRLDLLDGKVGIVQDRLEEDTLRQQLKETVYVPVYVQ